MVIITFFKFLPLDTMEIFSLDYSLLVKIYAFAMVWSFVILLFIMVPEELTMLHQFCWVFGTFIDHIQILTFRAGSKVSPK